MLDDIFMTMSTSTGMYPKLDLWTANKLQLQLQLLKVITIQINTYQRTVRLHNLSWISLACSFHSVLPFLLNRSRSVQKSVVITVVVVGSLPVLRLALLALCCSQQSHLHTHNACISKTLKIRIYTIMGKTCCHFCTQTWDTDLTWFWPCIVVNMWK